MLCSACRSGRLMLLIVFSAMVLWMTGSGCYSYEERWGRDTSKLNKEPVRQDRKTIEAARSEAIFEEQHSPEGDDSPVSVLFINGDPITTEDILKWMRPQLLKMKEAMDAREYMQKLVEIARATIRSRAESQLLYQVALDHFTESQQEQVETFVDQRIRDIINSEHGGRETRYEQYLTDNGITPQEDRARLRREMLIIAYLQETVGKKVASPTRRELEHYYEEYCSRMASEERRHMHLIEIPIESGADTRDAEQQAREALEKLRKGAEFAGVAKEFSQGINAASGGDWGPVAREGLRARWQRPVEKLYMLAEGETSDLVFTDEAIFIVYCSGIEKSDIKSFSEVQSELLENYKDRQFEMLAREMVNKLYETAVVRPANPGRFLQAVVDGAPKPG